ncbi:hypothetical protein DFJ58DRAFT_734882 [Suillus subalutaceus]|uniref:uncharacterized protein n=1 Tax=Suillus subalutaceus TaxID=48586 RepID=UPI001B86E5F1|nr:uncharacterized protein DFJ58DRAFT_734882 [Suillus subalutaceus]KAG1836582.1 hypothetical protein DFJ58DRAFT_734882 [Suillus subalutaceus]
MTFAQSSSIPESSWHIATHGSGDVPDFQSDSTQTLFAVAVTVAVLYDHGLTFGREIDYIWRRSPSLVTALYLLDRYLGDAVVIIGAYRIMQLRIYAMYQRTRRILVILVLAFFSEVLAVVVIIWRTIGPPSDFSPMSLILGSICAPSPGISTNFIYLFIPVFCFETLLFSLAIRVSLNNTREKRATPGTSSLRVNSFMSILVRDSILYFFINLAMCAIVMGLWRNLAELHANISIPFIMLLETVIGTRMVINFKEHCSRRLSSEPVMITGSIRFAGASDETARLDTIHDQSNEGDEEMRPIKSDEESAEVITYEL